MAEEFNPEQDNNRIEESLLKLEEQSVKVLSFLEQLKEHQQNKTKEIQNSVAVSHFLKIDGQINNTLQQILKLLHKIRYPPKKIFTPEEEEKQEDEPSKEEKEKQSSEL